MVLDIFGLDPLDIDRHLVFRAGMDKRLVDALVRVEQIGIFSAHGDLDTAFRVFDPVDKIHPAFQVGFAAAEF